VRALELLEQALPELLPPPPLALSPAGQRSTETREKVMCMLCTEKVMCMLCK
jgi:hypothetical protein